MEPRMFDRLELGDMPFALEAAEALSVKNRGSASRRATGASVRWPYRIAHTSQAYRRHRVSGGARLCPAKLFMAKHRAIARRNAIHAQVVLSWFSKWSPEGSWLWDTASAWLVMIGAALLVMWT